MLESATVPERMAKVAKQKADNKGFILTGVLMLRAAAEPARAARATRLETCIVIIGLVRVVWQETNYRSMGQKSCLEEEGRKV